MFLRVVLFIYLIIYNCWYNLYFLKYLQINPVINTKTCIQTERLNINLMSKDDLDDIHNYMTEQIVNNLGGDMRWPFTKKFVNDWLKKSLEASANNHFYNYVIRKKEDNAFVGMINIFVKQYPTCLFPGKISYWSAEHMRKNGYILESLHAVEPLYKDYFALNKIWTSVREDNLPSMNLLEKFGMQKTGKRMQIYNSKIIMEYIFEKDL